MSLTVAFQMDHISGIKIAGDSTFALMLEAEARGHRLFHYTVDTMAMWNGKVTAVAEPVSVRDVAGDHYTLGAGERVELSTFDVIHMRQDPPFDLAYISATHMLERIHPETLVVNDPVEVRNAPEKLFVVDFADLMPPTLITRDRSAIKAFREEHGEVVIKPLYGHGGNAVFRLHPDDQNYGSLISLFEGLYPEPWVIQRYLSEVRAGDKRILLVDGEFAGAVNRIPADDDLRSNMVQGGQAIATELTPREREICERLGPELKKRGLIFVGIDVIGDYLTEINVTSPTGIRSVKKLSGIDVAAMIWDSIEKRRG
ncbi:glutathione synthase [Rhodobium orientis]|uniref:Glutathione synthetase n=1 Tax=Rhodobium orientis TaxID=34017 RepID=A0A327JLG2_9HYPH|nr:glutathione synthase [Rhodobium orientis]MBB4301979.1 glutathione synthase [Rhodobium orientis]MBK5950216.1 glutathione synthase [Rhodobium orientis]RAI27179.1 glutathione synthase [Rhodobium orientis]